MIVIWLESAFVDLDDQIDYMARDDPGAAIDQRDLVESRVDTLAQFPKQGRIGREANTRELVVAGTPFVVVYRLKPRKGQVQILRILHGAQQWPPNRTRSS